MEPTYQQYGRDTQYGRPEADLHELRSQVSEIGGQLSSLLDRAKRDGGAIAEAELTHLQTQLNTLMGDMKMRGREYMMRAENTVRENPGTSLLAAFAAGAVLTLLLRK